MLPLSVHALLEGWQRGGWSPAESPRDEVNGAGHDQHAGQPPRRDGESRRIPRGPLDLPQYIGSLDHPVPPGVSNDRRYDDYAEASRNHVPAKDGERRQQDRENQKLSDLYTHVERE